MPSKANILFCELDPAGHAERERVILPMLAREEQARYRSFGAEARRCSWLTGRELLLAAIASLVGEADAEALLTDSSGGVRYAGDDIYLNLSHSGDLFAAAVSDVPVGVDIERIRPRAVTSQAARIFDPAEAEYLQRQTDPVAAFYHLWTLKEAACKATGLTIWDALRGICFDLDTDTCRLSPPFPAGPWRFMHASLEPGWRLGLALQAGGGTPKVEGFRRRDAGWERQSLRDEGFVAVG